jgi:hypothetical protein
VLRDTRTGEILECNKCGEHLTKDGQRRGKQTLVCKNGHYTTIDLSDMLHIESELEDNNKKYNTPSSSAYSFKEDKNKAEITTTTNIRIKKLEDLIRVCDIDTDIWEVDHWICNVWETGRKDVTENITWTNDKKNGSKRDSGKINTEQIFQVKAWLKKKVEEILLNDIKKEMIKEMKLFAPKYPRLLYKKINDKFLLELDIPDLHYGKLSWSEESGDDYDIKIAEEYALNCLQSLINQSSAYTVDRILFPIGNDFYNVNSKTETTIHNTPQQEDTRWQKTFIKGRQLAIKMIDMLSTIAPVDVLIIPGNHDEERTFYLGDSLECWYNNNKNVNINNKAMKRKYYLYGKNLIGLTHGYYEKLDRLPLLMSLEQPEMWAKSKFREWQTGDKHHKKEIKTSLRENESEGVMVRILRSLSANDAWHFDKGFVGSQRAGEAFIRHFDKGLIAQFTASI